MYVLVLHVHVPVDTMYMYMFASYMYMIKGIAYVFTNCLMVFFLLSFFSPELLGLQEVFARSNKTITS